MLDPKSPSKVPEKYMPKSVNPATDTRPQIWGKSSKPGHHVKLENVVLTKVFKGEMSKYKDESLQITKGRYSRKITVPCGDLVLAV